jgi:polar amino acid transport system substrate-binding protein
MGRLCSKFIFLPNFTKSGTVGFAPKNDELHFKEAINRTLLEIESSTEAAKIFEAWFGSGSKLPIARKFKIQPD